jgi:hypothetical protein
MANAQYASDAQCQTVCGILSGAMVTGMDTIACRTMAAAFKQGQQVPACWHAGPFGYGVCGAECDAFCAIATSVCSSVYPDMASCLMTCGDFTPIPADPAAYTTMGPTSGDNLACREYYLIAAIQDQSNCANTKLISPKCK